MAQDSPHRYFQIPHRQIQVHRSRITGKSKIPKILSLALGKRGEPVKVHELGLYLKIYIQEKILVYAVQYLHNRSPSTWTRTYSEACGNHGPELRKEKRKVIYQKEKERKDNILKRKADSHTKKLEAVLKHQKKKRNKQESNVKKKKNLYDPKLFM